MRRKSRALSGDESTLPIVILFLYIYNSYTRKSLSMTLFAAQNRVPSSLSLSLSLPLAI